MHITVAICTWNRAKLLDQTLAQMHNLRIPEGVTWELLVVNNNCTDGTGDVLERYAGALPLVRLFEKRQGHCYARNCAIEAAAGDLLIWTDDDVLVDPDWMTEYVNAAVRWPDAGAFGGAVDAWLEVEPAWWIRRHWSSIRGLFVIRERYVDAFPAPKEWSAVGASMAVRTSIAKKHRFDERLGRVGATLSGGDDVEWLDRLAKAGIQSAWVGSARLRHYIPKERLSERFLNEWFEGAGRTNVRMSGIDSSPRLFGYPRWALFQYVVAQFAAWVFRPFRGPRWYTAFRRAGILRGMIKELRQRDRNSPCDAPGREAVAPVR